jgi:hypothetical protein
MKKLTLIVLLLSVVGLGAGEVQHRIDAGVDSVEINTTVELECSDQCPVDSWSLTWSVPEEAAVREVKAYRGEVTQTRTIGDSLRIETDSDSPSDTETVQILMYVDREADEIHDGLYRREFSLPSFKGTETSGYVKADNLLSARMGYGFETGYSGDRMNFSGTGPSILRIKFGDGETTEYFEFFGEKRDDMGDAYRIPLGVTGNQQGFDRFPVAVLPDDKYNETLNRWSAGEYINGVIRIRGSLEDEFKPVLAHEVVHGLNDREFNWDSTSSSYMDEGTSRYVDHLVRKKMYNESETDRPPRELFGDSVRFDSDPNDGYYRELPSKGSREALWNYYKEDREFMKQWNPSDSRPEIRDFGYAYSELLVRNYVAKNNSLSSLYDRLEVNREVESNQEKWEVYSGIMEMRPCDYEDRERFDRCLDRINSYSYPIYSAEPANDTGGLNVKPVELPNREKPDTGPNLDVNVTSVTDEGLETALRSLLEGLRNALIQILRG